MNLFDKLVTEALKNLPQFSSLKIVVKKELLHHDILNALSRNNLLKDLTFIGGTCLRCCYGGVRLSEDLDFTGGSGFTKENLSQMGFVLRKSLEEKYGLLVHISEPIKEKLNVSTWKIKIETRPESLQLPAQKINIDIYALPSYERRPMMLLNPYGVDMGTSGLIIQAQSREEIYMDKLIAFALRPNRLKYRDLWDILWLNGLSVKPKFELLKQKLQDRNCSPEYFLHVFNERKQLLTNDNKMELEFNKEMQRFLPAEVLNQTLKQEHLWAFLSSLIENSFTQIRMQF